MTVDELIEQAHELRRDKEELEERLERGEVDYPEFDEENADIAFEAWSTLDALVDALEEQP